MKKQRQLSIVLVIVLIMAIVSCDNLFGINIDGSIWRCEFPGADSNVGIFVLKFYSDNSGNYTISIYTNNELSQHVSKDYIYTWDSNKKTGTITMEFEEGEYTYDFEMMSNNTTIIVKNFMYGDLIFIEQAI